MARNPKDKMLATLLARREQMIQCAADAAVRGDDNWRRFWDEERRKISEEITERECIDGNMRNPTL
jgi:hypothetical protein